MNTYQRYFILSLSFICLNLCSIFEGTAEAQYLQRRDPKTPPPSSRQTPSQTDSILQGGFGASLNIPFDDAEEVLDLSVSLHGTLLGQVDPAIKLEADLGYWFLQAADDENGDENEDPSLLTLTGGIRYYLNEALHLDGGLGLYRFSDWNVISDGISTHYDDQNSLGMYGGLGVEWAPLDVTLRVHYADFYEDIGDFWNIGLGVRVFFPSSSSLTGRR